MYAMATNNSEVNEGVQDTWTANESIQVAQEACQGDTREHEEPSTKRRMSFVPRNAEEPLRAPAAGDGPGGTGGRAFMAVGTAVLAGSGAPSIMKLRAVVNAITLEFIRWWNGRKRIAQCELIEGVPQEGGLAYKQHVSRWTNRPYTFTFSHPTDTITGIVCVPVDEKTQSPEAEVIEGGVNCKHATICLTPVDKGNWQCNVAICTEPSSPRPAIELDSTSAAAPPGDTPPAAASPVDSTHASAVPSPAVPAGTSAPPAMFLYWLVALEVVMVLMFIVIMIMMFVIILRS